MLSPEQRRLRARAAAYALHAQGGTNTRSAYAARIRKLEDRVDPDRALTVAERARRVDFAMRADMAALALKSSRARRKAA
jgi:hypothetical protein